MYALNDKVVSNIQFPVKYMVLFVINESNLWKEPVIIVTFVTIFVLYNIL